MHPKTIETSTENGPVVLIHGLGASKRDWESVGPVLEESGFTALCPDLLGHGESSKPDDPSLYHVDTMYSEFERWLHAQPGEEAVSIVGHSLGGYVALRYALDHPEGVRSLVLVNPFYKAEQLSIPMRGVHRNPKLSSMILQGTPHWLMRVVLSQMPRGPARFSWEMRNRIADDLKRASPHILNVSATLPDLEPEIPRVSTPVLLVWGEGDLTLVPSSFDALAQLLPNVDSHSFPGCGHQPHLAQPELFNQLVITFLTSHRLN